MSFVWCLTYLSFSQYFAADALVAATSEKEEQVAAYFLALAPH